MTAAEYALTQIRPGMVLGLGTGRAATAFVNALGIKVRQGLPIRGVPTSTSTANLAKSLSIPLTSLEESPVLDLTVDGADEVDPRLGLIKGFGGALLREKVVAASSRRLIILVGPEKLVPTLGCRGILPVEVVPFAEAYCRRRLKALGFDSALREVNGQRFISDNQNYILDVRIPTQTAPAETEQQILAIPGVVETGFFLNMAETIVVEEAGQVKLMTRAGQ